MSVIISGALAYDTILVHKKCFSESLSKQNLDCLNLTFSADTMTKAFGGCAGNIAWSLLQLGGDPLIWTALGQDGKEYLEHLEHLGIRTDGITIFEDLYCAQAFITTDLNGCQLTTFHRGALDRAADMPWPDDSDIDLGIIAAGGGNEMLNHAKIFAQRNIPFIFDVGQAAPRFSHAELHMFIEKCAYVAYSDYEATILRHNSGLSPEDIAAMGKPVFLTHGAAGSTVYYGYEKEHIPAIPVQAKDPVGAGDAYRGGVIFGITHGLTPIESARLGSLMGAAKVIHKGAQNYQITLDQIRNEYQKNWGTPPF